MEKIVYVAYITVREVTTGLYEGSENARGSFSKASASLPTVNNNTGQSSASKTDKQTAGNSIGSFSYDPYELYLEVELV